MGPLDPENAPFRCWEHEDCLEHPDLAIVCAGGTRAAALAMFDIYVYDGAFEDVSGDVLHPGGGTGDGYGSSGGGGDSSSVGRYFPYSFDPSDHEESAESAPEHGNLTAWYLALTEYEQHLWDERLLDPGGEYP